MRIGNGVGAFGIAALALSFSTTSASSDGSVTPTEVLVTTQSRCGESVSELSYRNFRNQEDEIAIGNEIVELGFGGEPISFSNTAQPADLSTHGWVVSVTPTCAVNDATSFVVRIGSGSQERVRYITVFRDRYLISDLE